MGDSNPRPARGSRKPPAALPVRRALRELAEHTVAWRKLRGQTQAQVAERAGAVATQVRQRIAGVIENMAGFACPHCDEVVEVFGSGGGQAVADSLSKLVGAPVPLLGSVPIEPGVREGGDAGTPVVVGSPDSAAAKAFIAIATALAGKQRGLAGRPLTLTPV